MMCKLLTIAIPTYNRLCELKNCLGMLLPQVSKYCDDVSIFVTDNCSTDGTDTYMLGIISDFAFVYYHRNEKNLGYSGNQINCLKIPDSIYTAILCDDDLYVEGAVSEIINVLKQNEYSFVALNYYSFKKSYLIPVQSNFAPLIDKNFPRAYDILNYPSVGHYSGFIFNSKEAKATLKSLLINFDQSYYEQQRGIIVDVAVRQLSKSSLPSYFIGKQIVAAKMPDKVDYDSFTHLCIEYYKYYLSVFTEDIITESDLVYRKKLVKSWMPKMAALSLYKKNKKEISLYWEQINHLGLVDKRNRIILFFIFQFSKFYMFRSLIGFLHRVYKKTKYKLV